MPTCKECIHFVMCDEVPTKLADDCDFFKDCSLFVELPCKVGETVYMITQQTERVGRKKVTNNVIIEFCVDNFRIGDAGYPSAALCDNENVWHYGIMPEMFGTIVFFTRKEAEQALKEREG